MSSGEVDTRQLARLLDGLAALDEGRLGDARYRFDQIISSVGREHSLESGHASRGLAEISIRRGDISAAEAQLKSAVTAYREVGRLDPTARARAGEGEGMVLLLGAELLLRRGMFEPGTQVLKRASKVFEKLGDDRSAEAWGATGRLAMHMGHQRAAEHAFDEALSRYESARNYAGHSEILLEAAALKVEQGDKAAAARMLDLASTMARNAGRQSTCARAHLGRARLALDSHAAMDAWKQALQAATASGDCVNAGFALLGLGGAGWKGGEQPLLAGAQLLLDGGHYPGLGLALLRIGEHALRRNEPDLALVASEGAWRVYRGYSAAEGLGRVLRIVIKSFAGLRVPRPTLLAAFARAALVGKAVPHAVEVRDHYASLAPSQLRVRYGTMSTEELVNETRRALQRRIVPALRSYGLLAQSFATAQGALDVLGVMVGVSPRAAARQLAPSPRLDTPNELPEPDLPDLEDLQFGRRTTAKLSLGGTPSSSPAYEPPRSIVYDPDGRLAALASKSLVFVDGDGEDDDDPATEEAPAVLPQEAFPDDAGIGDWMKPGGDVDWQVGADLFGDPPSSSGSSAPRVELFFEDGATEDTDPSLSRPAIEIGPPQHARGPSGFDLSDEPTDPRLDPPSSEALPRGSSSDDAGA